MIVIVGRGVLNKGGLVFADTVTTGAGGVGGGGGGAPHQLVVLVKAGTTRSFIFPAVEKLSNVRVVARFIVIGIVAVDVMATILKVSVPVF